MPTATTTSSSSAAAALRRHHHHHPSSPPLARPSLAFAPLNNRRLGVGLGLRLSQARNSPLVVSASAQPFDGLDSDSRVSRHDSKKTIILNLVQEIEPLDVSLIQKDVPANTVDAMKRTISGMLGLLPSDQFHVQVEALWGPLSKLLTSSMKTGYTLRNAEYRLCLERNLDIHEEDTGKRTSEAVEDGTDVTWGHGSASLSSLPGVGEVHSSIMNDGEPLCQNSGGERLREVTPEAEEYIRYLQSRLESTEKELHDIKRKISALQMQQFVGEEKNDLLDYLRSLQPEKVAELSEPTCPGVEESIHSVVHGLLATLSPKIHSNVPPHPSGESLGIKKDDYAELVEDTSIQFQPLISVPRDYLARLLFWCMLLGHYIRGLEYRLDLMQLFTISGNVETVPCDGDSLA